MAEHVLVIEPDQEYIARFADQHGGPEAAIRDGAIRVRVECPAGGDPAAGCAAWKLCGHHQDPDDDDSDMYEIAEDPCEHSPTGEHQVLNGELMMPTPDCYVASNADLSDAAQDALVGLWSDEHPKPGRHPVEWRCEDGEWLYLSLIEEADRDQPKAARLSVEAVATLAAAGFSPSEWARMQGYRDGWGGDACGCPDDRCIGYHHDLPDECGCLRVLIEEAIGAY